MRVCASSGSQGGRRPAERFLLAAAALALVGAVVEPQHQVSAIEAVLEAKRMYVENQANDNAWWRPAMRPRPRGGASCL